MASSTSTYFQGGDYVELLSAQGKAPASAWKLQGKILKSFEKTIKGNAFQLDGSAETKMQLPKAATTQSLGLSQRFVVFQLAIPFTRSFSIEIGFSDFQKIRRRFVFASAFRETAMTSLHVQIPFDARVTRDQWINLVFDLQALTETYFSGSTFRSMESICISGSCKLKRVFTMKDAPKCDLPMSIQQTQPVASGKRAAAAAVQVASYADMKEIPKQFLFSSGGPGSIPTEYFVLASSSVPAAHTDARESSSAVASQTRGKSAPTTGVHKQKPLLAKKASSTRPVSGSAAASARPATSSSAGRAPTPRIDMDDDRLSHAQPESKVMNQSRPVSSSPLSSSNRSPERPGSATVPMRDSRERLSRNQSPEKDTRTAARLSSSNNREAEQLETRLSQPKYDAFLNHEHDRTSESEDEREEEETKRTPPSSRPSRAERQKASVSSAEIKTSKDVHRRAIIAEIQQKLDILSDDDELEAERNTKLFLQHTSIPQESPSQPAAQQKRDLIDDEHELGLGKLDRHPHSGRSRAKTRKPSIFSFARTRGSDGDDDDDDRGVLNDALGREKRITKLFDFASLLESPRASSSSEPSNSDIDKVSASRGHSDLPRKSSSWGISPATKGSHAAPELAVLQSRSRAPLSDDDDDDDDQALADLLIAKRNARRAQQQQDEKILETHSTQSRSNEAIRSSRCNITAHDLAQESEQELDGESEVVQPAESSRLNAPGDGEEDEDGNAENEEDNLSIDLTDDLDEDDASGDHNHAEGLSNARAARGEAVEGSGDEQQDDDDDDDKSFDFDDLVDERESGNGATDAASEPASPQQSPVAVSRSFSIVDQKPNSALVSSSTPKAICSPHQLTTGRKLRQQRREVDDELEFSMSPPHKSLSAHPINRHDTPRSSELSFSSSRRLASLLESTDWSQLEPPETKSAKKTANEAEKHRRFDATRQPARAKHSTPATPAASSSTSVASLELIYDPLLNCYYDPVANKYYALASE